MYILLIQTAKAGGITKNKHLICHEIYIRLKNAVAENDSEI